MSRVCLLIQHGAIYNRGKNKECFSEATLLTSYADFFQHKLAFHEVLINALLSQQTLKIFTFETSRIMQPHDLSPDIPIYIQQDATLHGLLLYLENALHVSSGTSIHHQERIQLYLQHLVLVTPLLLPATRGR